MIHHSTARLSVLIVHRWTHNSMQLDPSHITQAFELSSLQVVFQSYTHSYTHSYTVRSFTWKKWKNWWVNEPCKSYVNCINVKLSALSLFVSACAGDFRVNTYEEGIYLQIIHLHLSQAVCVWVSEWERGGGVYREHTSHGSVRASFVSLERPFVEKKTVTGGVLFWHLMPACAVNHACASSQSQEKERERESWRCWKMMKQMIDKCAIVAIDYG